MYRKRVARVVWKAGLPNARRPAGELRERGVDSNSNARLRSESFLFPATRNRVNRLLAGVDDAMPPDDRKALYMQILQDRYGPWGMAKIGARKLLGMKI